MDTPKNAKAPGSEGLLAQVKNPGALAMGQIVRRTNKEKDQQGCFVRLTDDGALVVINVIDLIGHELVASEGLMRLQPGDRLGAYASNFRDSPSAAAALKLVKAWPLFRDNPSAQESILRFVASSFVPEQVLEWKAQDALTNLFVPIMQKFRLGRFTERRDPDRVCRERFKALLDELELEAHLTYVADLGIKGKTSPRFFSAGTKPHQTTETLLQDTDFSFAPTRGGHLRAVPSRKGKTKAFLVDAGSNHFGKGASATLASAQEVAEYMAVSFPDYEFIPCEGRGAYSIKQSY
jgi:hypothetical protein